MENLPFWYQEYNWLTTTERLWNIYNIKLKNIIEKNNEIEEFKKNLHFKSLDWNFSFTLGDDVATEINIVKSIAGLLNKHSDTSC